MLIADPARVVNGHDVESRAYRVSRRPTMCLAACKRQAETVDECPRVSCFHGV